MRFLLRLALLNFLCNLYYTETLLVNTCYRILSIKQKHHLQLILLFSIILRTFS